MVELYFTMFCSFKVCLDIMNIEADQGAQWKDDGSAEGAKWILSLLNAKNAEEFELRYSVEPFEAIVLLV